MLDFSQLLSSFIKMKNVKVYAMAQYCDLDRSTMYKIIRGRRTPSSPVIVGKIAEFMHLIPSEERDLFEAYKVALAGYDNYYRRKDVFDFLNNFSNIDHFAPAPYITSPLPNYSNDITALMNEAEVNQAVFNAVMQEFQEENPNINLLVQPEYSFLINLLISSLPKNRHVCINHIMCFHNTEQIMPSKKDYNLQCMKNILFLYERNCQYESYYYYGSILPCLDTFHLFPYLILTKKHGIILSETFQTGFLYHHTESIQLLKSIFSEYLKQARPLLKKSRNAYEQIKYAQEFYQRDQKKFCPKYAFQMEPCLTPFLSKSLLEKHIHLEMPDRETFILFLSNYINLLSTTYEKYSPTFIISEDGFTNFLNTGRLNEYPVEAYTPLETSYRIYFAKLFLKKYNFRLLKNKIGNIEHGLNIYVNEISGYLFFVSPVSNESIYLDMAEPGLISTFYDFFEHMEDDMFYTQDEATQRLTNLIDSYNTKKRLAHKKY